MTSDEGLMTKFVDHLPGSSSACIIPNLFTSHGDNLPVCKLEVHIPGGQGVGFPGEGNGLFPLILLQPDLRQAMPQPGVLGIHAQGPFQSGGGAFFSSRVHLLTR